MVGTTTVSKAGGHDAVLKLTGHEKGRVSICLTKLKPSIVFKDIKREISNLNQEFCGKCITCFVQKRMNEHTVNEHLNWFKIFEIVYFRSKVTGVR